MAEYASKSDPQLVALICQGNQYAFAELVQRHTDLFFALAYRTLQSGGDAEDVVQKAFIKFWQRPQLWNPDKSKFTTWFYRVIINACHDLQRRGARQRVLESSLAEQSEVCVDSEELGIEQRQLESWRRECVESGIRALPTSQRAALNLVVYCEIAQKEAAEILGVKLKALESLLQRAKKNLIKHVQEKSLESPLTEQIKTEAYRENQ